MTVKDTLVYVHIPKSAGTTLNSILLRNHKGKALYASVGLANVIELSAEEKANVGLVYGHIPFGVHEILDRPVQYITMLRHPVARIISHYKYVKRQTDHYLHEEVMSNNMSLLEYVTSNLSLELNNGQTRLLSNIERYGTAHLEQSDYELALNNIKNEFTCVGIQEAFNKSILLFQKILNWKTPYYKSKNRSQSSKKEISEDVREAIIAHNQYDMMLYQEAMTIFQNQLETYLPDIEQKLWWFEQKNYWISRFRRL